MFTCQKWQGPRPDRARQPRALSCHAHGQGTRYQPERRWTPGKC